MLLSTDVLKLHPIFSSNICLFLYVSPNNLYMSVVQLAESTWFKFSMSKATGCSINHTHLSALQSWFKFAILASFITQLQLIRWNMKFLRSSKVLKLLVPFSLDKLCKRLFQGTHPLNVVVTVQSAFACKGENVDSNDQLVSISYQLSKLCHTLFNRLNRQMRLSTDSQKESLYKT
jgi:hypothetical protein